MNRRLGIIQTSQEMAEEYGLNILKAWIEIGFFPIDINSDFYNGNYMYKGTSDLFEPVFEGQEIPRYHIEIEMGKDGDILSAKVEVVK